MANSPAWFYHNQTGEPLLAEDGKCPAGYADAPGKKAAPAKKAKKTTRAKKAK